MMWIVVLGAGLLMLAGSGWAQHGHEGHAMPDSVHVQAEPEATHTMSSALLPNLPMTVDASGTSWLPEHSPMYAAHAMRGRWEFMVHGRAFARYTAQDAFDSGTRGESRLGGPNWIMAMAKLPLSAQDQIGFRGMFSLDPAIEGKRGYPLLFQVGESAGGAPLIDRQHPHDLFSELSVLYGHSIGDAAGAFAYFGWPGEPALGPPAFMHRPSAQHNPDSPLGHHWQDATHIAFGVATLGARWGVLKVDGSVFTGREPDEERYNIEEPRFDSYSGRISVSPTERWAVQASRGFLQSPERLYPEENQWRTTASVLFHDTLEMESHWTSALVWGMNEPAGEHDGEAEHSTTHTLLLESDLQLEEMAYWTRIEAVQRPTVDLGLTQLPEESYWVGALTLGIGRLLMRRYGLELMAGGQGTFYVVPGDLHDVYGDSPVSLQVYLSLSPELMRMGHGRH